MKVKSLLSKKKRTKFKANGYIHTLFIQIKNGQDAVLKV